MTEQAQQQNDEIKLYAGKFKTVEDLEEGYKNSFKLHQENEALKKKVDEITKIPDEYITPQSISLAESDLAEVKIIAKNSFLTQAQYEKLINETYARAKAKQDSFEAAKKEVGADNINLLQDFVKKAYGDKAGNTLLKKAIIDKELREEIMAQRTAALNSQAPGIGTVNIGRHSITKEDILKAREAITKASGKAKIEQQNKYISLQRQYAHQDKK